MPSFSNPLHSNPLHSNPPHAKHLRPKCPLCFPPKPRSLRPLHAFLFPPRTPPIPLDRPSFCALFQTLSARSLGQTTISPTAQLNNASHGAMLTDRSTPPRHLTPPRKKRSNSLTRLTASHGPLTAQPYGRAVWINRSALTRPPRYPPRPPLLRCLRIFLHRLTTRSLCSTTPIAWRGVPPKVRLFGKSSLTKPRPHALSLRLTHPTIRHIPLVSAFFITHTHLLCLCSFPKSSPYFKPTHPPHSPSGLSNLSTSPQILSSAPISILDSYSSSPSTKAEKSVVGVGMRSLPPDNVTPENHEG